ncbi:transposase [Janthinobacterium aestuarii]
MVISGKWYTEEFKLEAVKNISERGYAVVEIAPRVGCGGNPPIFRSC